MFKELLVLICENEVTKSTNYLILALTAYKAAAEVIVNRLVYVTILYQIIKPVLNLENTRNSNGIIKQFSHLSEVLPIFF